MVVGLLVFAAVTDEPDQFVEDSKRDIALLEHCQRGSDLYPSDSTILYDRNGPYRDCWWNK